MSNAGPQADGVKGERPMTDGAGEDHQIARSVSVAVSGNRGGLLVEPLYLRTSQRSTELMKR